MEMIRSLLFVILAVFGTDSSTVRGNKRETFQPSEYRNEFLTDNLNEQPDFGELILGALQASPVAVDEVRDLVDENVDNNNRNNNGELTHEKESGNNEEGPSELLCYGANRFGETPKILCRGSCFIREHWTRLGLIIHRGCSPLRQKSQTIFEKPELERFCNKNLCNYKL